MKTAAAMFAAGYLAALGTSIILGGEVLTQAGLRLTAIEQGFSLASRHWQFEATPAHEQVSYDAGDRLAYEAPKAKKGKR